MNISIIVIILFISFMLAIFSMRDFDVADEIKNLILRRKIRGTIVFFKGKKVVHYHEKRKS